MKVIAFTFNEGNGRRKIQRPSLIDCTEELPDDCIPPQRESIKDYRRITCEKGKYLAK